MSNLSKPSWPNSTATPDHGKGIFTVKKGISMFNKTPGILIVDDMPSNLQVLGQILKSQKYIIMVASNGQTALNMVVDRKPDLILLDIMMPEMDGFEVCRRLKSSDATKSIPIIFLTAKTDSEDVLKGFEMGAVDYITKPFNAAELLSRVRTHIELRMLQTNLESAVDSRTKELHSALDKLKIMHSTLQGTYLEIINRLALAAEYRDNETGQHVLRMSHFSSLLARAAGFDENYCHNLLHASSMHDVGKIGIPDSILLKPGKLTSEEFEIMKSHTIIGGELLSGIDSDVCHLARAIALTHHEKWNGKGYPNALSGKKIPMEGRIVAVADVFDALTSVRPYKKAWETDDAIALLKKEKGEHFDPYLVDLFIDNLPGILEIKHEFVEDEELTDTAEPEGDQS
ncbi:Response regulator receiver [Desulfamplus magnetovallimortis]|uniref:Response regulator receiver n=1 Tax=Desulfamplus magnetovallimortis TaxID=1246637 RepID=A0A1W1HFQ8_9BACT|nr:two-component system response regulator [Desulfamplus magnetovallimortis]SLM31351.1 Response regulator receiver [Desulfamplus magnetovallimortis]